MAKLARATLKQFAKDVNAAADIGQYGSGAAGSPVFTSVIATIQGLAAWTTGWAAETVANNRPFLEDMNAVDFVFGYMLCYIFQEGIPEYDAGTTYYVDSIVKYSGVLYQSLTDNNLANTPVVGANWKLVIGTPSGLRGAYTSRIVGTVYGPAATDLWVKVLVSATTAGDGGYAQGKTDASNPPTTVDSQASACDPASGQDDHTVKYSGFKMWVKKGEYYKVEEGAFGGATQPTVTVADAPIGN